VFGGMLNAFWYGYELLIAFGAPRYFLHITTVWVCGKLLVWSCMPSYEIDGKIRAVAFLM